MFYLAGEQYISLHALTSERTYKAKDTSSFVSCGRILRLYRLSSTMHHMHILPLRSLVQGGCMSQHSAPAAPVWN